MFNLLPWRKERRGEGALIRRGETPLELMRRDLAPLFARFFGGLPIPVESLYEAPPYWGLEMEEAANEVVIKAEMPGFEPTEIEVVVIGDTLKIKAEHKVKVKGKEKEEEAVERRVEREVTLPVGTATEKVEARYHNGLLEIHLPRTPEVTPRRIEVKV
jgi:HSP20 family protein